MSSLVFVLNYDFFAEPLHATSVPRVYPNPVKNQLRITNYELQKDGESVIYSVVGQVVMVGAYPCGRPEITIDISHLASGMYFLKVDGKVVRFVKE